MIGVAADPQWGKARECPPACAGLMLGGTAGEVLTVFNNLN